MAEWLHRITIKQLFTKNKDWKSIQKSMNQVADVLDNSPCFIGFSTKQFRKIPKGDDFFTPLEYANKLLGYMYDFADYHRIWID